LLCSSIQAKVWLKVFPTRMPSLVTLCIKIQHRCPLPSQSEHNQVVINHVALTCAHGHSRHGLPWRATRMAPPPWRARTCSDMLTSCCPSEQDSQQQR
jgi:hypothetical protein